MGTGIVTYGTDPRAKTITVYYTESSTIYEGMPVCYEFDATTNWLGVSSIDATSTASSITESSTTAEGSANEGKFIRVEDPDADNIHAFAGVVAGAGSPIGSTGPCALDIYIPNGAIVPVRTDQSCTVGRTILAVHTAEQHLTGPYETAAKPVAVAWETDTDLASTTGTVLAKLDPNLFISQKGDATHLLIDDQDAANTMFVNQIKLSTATTGNFCALTVQTSATGACNSSGYGLALYVQADLTVAMGGISNAFGAWTNVTGGTQTNDIYAGEFGIYESGANLAAVERICPLMVRTQLDGTNPPSDGHYMMAFICDGTGDHPDGWFQTNEIQDIALTAASSVTVAGKIAFKVGTPGAETTWYIPCGTTAG